MRRSDRLFDIIQALRGAPTPLTARELATRLEVATRTIYRDIATLQARRLPIEGAPGVGYVLRKGYDLPPLMFTTEEAEAIAVGARMVRRLRDDGLQRAADSVLSKLSTAVPETLRTVLVAPRIWVSDGDAARPTGVDLAEIRGAIRTARKLRIAYTDEHRRKSRRTICPIAMVYYVDATLIAAWCELRSNYRHFRIERIRACVVLDDTFSRDAGRLMVEWLRLQNEESKPHS